jgi:hypothetical protein
LQFQSRKVDIFKDPLFPPRGRILVIHAWKSLNRKNYCKEERNFKMQIWICMTIWWNFAQKNLSGHIGFPMDDVLVNAGSHNPPSNVFYMLHKALGGGHSQNQGTVWDGAKCNLTTGNTLAWWPCHAWNFVASIYFLVKPYLLGMNF